MARKRRREEPISEAEHTSEPPPPQEEELPPKRKAIHFDANPKCCSACKVIKPATEFRRRTKIGGLYKQCRDCENEGSRLYYARIKADPSIIGQRKRQRLIDNQLREDNPPEFKQCRSCDEVKSAGCFNKGRASDGLFEHCRNCQNKGRQTYRNQVKAKNTLNPPTIPQSKHCTKCDLTKPADDFDRSVYESDGLNWLCRSCDGHRRQNRTLPSYLRCLIVTAKKTTLTRNARKGRTATECTLTYDELLDIYNRQSGFCYYFKTKRMSLISHSEWMMSLERLDPTKGYNKENVVLCCNEYNVRNTWTQGYIDEVVSSFTTGNEATERTRIEQLINDIRVRDPTRWPLPKTTRHCTNPEHTASWNNEDGACKACVAVYNYARENTPYAFTRSLLHNAKKGSKKRGLGPMTLTVEDIITLVQRQRGLCAYSSLKLGFVHGSPWQCSPERREPAGDYTLDNVVLICLQFNSTCNRRHYKGYIPKEDESIGGQWTRSKFLEWYDYLVTAKAEKEGKGPELRKEEEEKKEGNDPEWRLVAEEGAEKRGEEEKEEGEEGVSTDRSSAEGARSFLSVPESPLSLTLLRHLLSFSYAVERVQEEAGMGEEGEEEVEKLKGGRKSRSWWKVEWNGDVWRTRQAIVKGE